MRRPRGVFAALLALCLLTGCASPLEGRSYSVEEPYTDRYWDPAAEDTMRAETYQDLVNSLLLLLDQRSEEGTIRYYGDEDAFTVANAARSEVCRETMMGAYLIDHMTFLMDWQEDYTAYTFTLVYRKDAENVDSLMAISDSQSLADLLRLALREELERLTVSFPHETVSREEVAQVVDQQWEALYLESLAPEEASEETSGEAPAPETEQPPEETEAEAETPPDGPDGEDPAGPEGGEIQEPPPPEIPPCPWVLRFYPDVDRPGIVELWLTGGTEALAAAAGSRLSQENGPKM